MDWQQFQEFARGQMERHFGLPLSERQLPDVPKRFDLVSPDGKIVGDAKYPSLVNRQTLPPAKFMEIAGHVWLLEKTRADSLFLVFGNQREVPAWWLKKYRTIVGRVAFYFLHDDGKVETLT